MLLAGYLGTRKPVEETETLHRLMSLAAIDPREHHFLGVCAAWSRKKLEAR